MTAEKLIDLLNLQPLPIEGGYYTQTHVSSERYSAGDGFLRPLTTLIYYLITAHSFSRLHRLDSDEVFHFYGGDPAEMLQLFPDGSGKVIRIGTDIENDERPQIFVPKGVWQATRLIPGGTYSLFGTTMSPGYSQNGFEIGDCESLIKLYPFYAKLISELTAFPQEG